MENHYTRTLQNFVKKKMAMLIKVIPLFINTTRDVIKKGGAKKEQKKTRAQHYFKLQNTNEKKGIQENIVQY